jgi:hypothetical protein
VYTGQTGWVVVDATPGGGQAGSGGRRSWWQRFSDAWQTWRFRWQDGVFGYDAAAQQRLQAWIADRWDDVRVVAKEAWAAVGRGMIELVARGHVTAAILWLAAAVAGLSVVIEILIVARAVRRRIVTARQVRRQLGLRIRDLRFMIRLYRLLRRHRLQPVPGETLRELAARAAGVLGCPAEAVTSLVDLYYRLRWGPPGQAAEGLPAQIAAAERFVERLYRPARDAVA